MFILPRESQAGRSCDDFQVCEIRMELGSVDGSDSFMSTSEIHRMLCTGEAAASE